MTDQELFDAACVQIVLEGERGSDGSLTINGWSYESFPETLTVHGQRWRLVDEEDHEVEDEEGQEFTAVRAFYDVDSDDEGEDEDEGPDTCEKCGGEMDKDCQGEPRCPECDPPCPSCHDGGGPV